MAKKKSSPTKPLPYPKGGTFGQLLEWHLKWGTCPDCSTSKQNTPWVYSHFGSLVLEEGSKPDNIKTNLKNWRSDRLPSAEDKLGQLRIQRIFLELFGDDPHLRKWKNELEAALEKGRAAQQARIKGGKSPTVANVPRPTIHFTGRKNELDALVSDVMSKGPQVAILIQGGPGIGKTELTKAVAHHPIVVETFGERRWFVSLQTTTTVEGVKDAIGRAIGYERQNGFRAALNSLGKRPALLVLDNMETPWEADEERERLTEVLHALGGVPYLSVLASFRGYEEVGGLRWKKHPVNPLSRQHSTDLLASIGGEWLLTDSHLERFVEALGGIPLAIDLVARRILGRSSLAPLWNEWLKVGSDFAKRLDRAEGPLTSLPHSIELSLRSPRINAHENAMRLFRLLGRLPAGLLPDDRDALIGTGAYDAEDRLLGTGLGIERSGRIDLLPPIRLHAAKYYPPQSNDAAAFVERYLEAVPRYDGLPLDQFNGVSSRICDDFPNIEAAMLAAPYDRAMRELDGFCSLALRAGFLSDIFGDLYRSSLHHNDLPGQAMCFRKVGEMFITQTEVHLATEAFQCANKIYSELNDIAGVALCLKSLGDIQYVHANYAEARSLLEQALSRFEQTQNVLQMAQCELRLGDVHEILSQYDTAQIRFESALRRFRQTNDLLGEARCYRGMGSVRYQTTGNGMEEYFDRAMLLFRQIGDLKGEADTLVDIGNIAALHSDYDNAILNYEKALPTYVGFNDHFRVANCRLSLAEAAFSRGDYRYARESFTAASSLYELLEDQLGIANCKKGEGNVALASGQYETARAFFEDALALYNKIGSIAGEAQANYCLSDVARLLSDFDAARLHLNRSLALSEKIGNVLGKANCLYRLSEIAMMSDADWPSAQKSLELARPLYEQCGDVLGQANCMLSFGNIAFNQEAYESARAHFENALVTYRKSRNIKGQASSFRGLAIAAAKLSQFEQARIAFTAAASHFQEVGNKNDEAACIAGAGEIALCLGDKEGMRISYMRARDLYRETGASAAEAHCSQMLSRRDN